jgi:hypothetical protein
MATANTVYEIIAAYRQATLHILTVVIHIQRVEECKKLPPKERLEAVKLQGG